MTDTVVLNNEQIDTVKQTKKHKYLSDDPTERKRMAFKAYLERHPEHNEKVKARYHELKKRKFIQKFETKEEFDKFMEMYMIEDVPSTDCYVSIDFSKLIEFFKFKNLIK
jgi:mRNA-degrading endonuclease HigB of HigAB toxin-antitoxin module